MWRKQGRCQFFNDILDNKVLGREFKRGVQEGELTVLRRQIEKRFGALPGWAEERLAGRTTTELEELSIRVLDAQNPSSLNLSPQPVRVPFGFPPLNHAASNLVQKCSKRSSAVLPSAEAG